MKVYLSNKKCIDQSTKHCTNLAALDSIALDSEITNLVILKDWKMSLVLVDTLWGVIVTSSMAFVGYKAHSFFS